MIDLLEHPPQECEIRLENYDEAVGLQTLGKSLHVISQAKPVHHENRVFHNIDRLNQTFCLGKRVATTTEVSTVVGCREDSLRRLVENEILSRGGILKGAGKVGVSVAKAR